MRSLEGTCLPSGVAALIVSLATCAPTWAQCLIQKLTQNKVGDYFAYRVSLSGERLAVTCDSSGQNAVCVYERFGSTWFQTATIEPPVPDQLFGMSLDLDGDRLVVGDPAAAPSGSAYVFEWAPSGWVQAAKLKGYDAGAEDWFGRSVAIDGDFIVVGAPEHKSPLYKVGAAYVFRRDSDGTWKNDGKLSPQGGNVGSKMGWSIDMKDGVVVAGAPFDSELGFSSGAGFVFERLDGAWQFTGKLLAPDQWGFSAAGVSVACDSQFAFTGATGSVYPAATGAVHVFIRKWPGAWRFSQTLLPNDGTTGQGFGSAIDTDGSQLMVGSPGDAKSSGSAYILSRVSGGEWTEIAKLVPGDLTAWDEFGSAVALSGKLGAVGTFPTQPPKPGSAYLFAVGPDVNNNGLMDPCECPGDLNEDWIVDQADLGLLLANWGCTGVLGYEPSTKPCPGAQTGCCGDLDADGDVDQSDLGIMLQNFGNVCP